MANAAIVKTSFVLRSKSPTTAGETGAADTVIVVSSLDGRSRLAVTTVVLAFSDMDSGDRCNVTIGAGSSSSRVNSTSAASITPSGLSFTAVADTVTVLSGASTSLSTALIVTVPTLAVARAAIVKTLFALNVKSPATAGDSAAASTVTVVVVLDGWLRLAVTTVVLAFSEMKSGVRCSVTVGAPSSSASVSVDEDTIRSPDVPLTAMVSFTLSTKSMTGLRTNSPCPLSLSASMTMSKPGTGVKPTTPALPEPATVTLTVVVAA